MMIIKRPLQYATVIDKQGDFGVFDTMEDAIRLAYTASEEYSKYTLEKKNDVIDAVIKVLEDHLEELSLMISKETNNQSYEDILYKNTNALKNCKNDKYLEARLTSNKKANNSENPYTVNGVIISGSNPIETIIKNSILMLKTGNSIVFSSDKKIRHTFGHAIKLLNNAILAANGPKNLLVTVKEPNDENTNIMIEHEKITLISAIDTNQVENIAL